MAQGADEVKNPLAGWSKPQWRGWARRHRAGLDRVELSGRLRAHVRAWLATRPPTTVVLYRAMGDELDLDELAGDAGPHAWATTRTPPSGPLSVHPWDGPSERHPFGFVQPSAQAPLVDGAAIGIVLAPGLVFDRRGGRIGYGKGYYDRLLAGLPGAVAVGVTAEALVVDDLPTDDGDVAMRWLATETGMWPVPTRDRAG